jgi:predicted Ser/Thr protein kinase
MDLACTRCGGRFPADQVNQRFQGVCPKCLAAVVLNPTEPAAPGEAPPLKPGDRFRNLEVLELLGQGGMGLVYKARQPELDRAVALKLLPRRLAEDPGFVQRFQREARALASLSHPNIVGVHEFGTEGGLCFFVMELVDGVNLRQVLRERKLAPEEALGIVPQLCDALQYAHLEGVVHRDIKPENILLDRKGRVKISDFGLAKLVSGDGPATITRTDSLMGTPAYMAPEQLENPKRVDHRADIYSMGVVFYEMLTGELPVGRFEPPSRRVEVDVRVDEIVLRALEKLPERRYQHASEVKDAVTKVGAAQPAPASWALAALASTFALWALVFCGTVVAMMLGRSAASPAPLLLVGLAGGILSAWVVWPPLSSGKSSVAPAVILAAGAIALAAAYLFAISRREAEIPFAPAGIYLAIAAGFVLTVIALRRARGMPRKFLLAGGLVHGFAAVFVSALQSILLVFLTQHVPPAPLATAPTIPLERLFVTDQDLPGLERLSYSPFHQRNPLLAEDPSELEIIVNYLYGLQVRNLAPSHLRRGYWAYLHPDFLVPYGFIALEAADEIVARRIVDQLSDSRAEGERWTHQQGRTVIVAYCTKRLRHSADFDYLVNVLKSRLGLQNTKTLTITNLRLEEEDLPPGCSLPPQDDQGSQNPITVGRPWSFFGGFDIKESNLPIQPSQLHEFYACFIAPHGIRYRVFNVPDRKAREKLWQALEDSSEKTGLHPSSSFGPILTAWSKAPETPAGAKLDYEALAAAVLERALLETLPKDPHDSLMTELSRAAAVSAIEAHRIVTNDPPKIEEFGYQSLTALLATLGRNDPDVQWSLWPLHRYWSGIAEFGRISVVHSKANTLIQGNVATVERHAHYRFQVAFTLNKIGKVMEFKLLPSGRRVVREGKTWKYYPN